jgi:ABC-type multidrug transport system permease subunit
MSNPRRFGSGPLAQLSLVRAREFLREPEAVFWTFLFPVLMAAGLGLAFRSRPAEVTRIAVLASAPGAAALQSRLEDAPGLEVQVLDDSAATRALRTGRIALVVVPASESGDRVTYRYDETRPEGVLARRVADDAVQRSAGRADPVAVEEDRVREAGSRYIDFVVPGLLGMSLLGSGVWGTGFPIVDARRKRLLKRLTATPMPRSAFLASFLFSRLGILVLEAGALLLFARLVFGIPLRGSLLVLVLICLLGALAFGALGLLVAARPRTIEGASGVMNLAMVPMWVLSGIFFSASRFPEAVQPLIQALPLTAVNDALRANMIEGATLAQIAPELGIVAAWLVVCFGIALKIFRWQ